jgi:conjugative transfer region protein (TIGR03748 family)
LKTTTPLKILIAIPLGLGVALSQAANVTQINRYASVENKPLIAQVNPLLTVQQIHFPQHVMTVGDALRYWVQYSGFKLASDTQLPDVLKILMQQPLPQVDRNLGPLTIQDGLTVLVGQEEFTLVQNHLSRTVNFKLRMKHTPARGR